MCRADGRARKQVIPVPPVLQAKVKFVGRYKRGFIRDGVFDDGHLGLITALEELTPILRKFLNRTPE